MWLCVALECQLYIVLLCVVSMYLLYVYSVNVLLSLVSAYNMAITFAISYPSLFLSSFSSCYSLSLPSLSLNPGGDISYHLEKQGRFAVPRVRLYVAELSLALEYLREHRVIHRDVKPANMLLDSGGHVHLTDFNVACIVRSGVNITSVTGTKPYMGEWVSQPKCTSYIHTIYVHIMYQEHDKAFIDMTRYSCPVTLSQFEGGIVVWVGSHESTTTTYVQWW